MQGPCYFQPVVIYPPRPPPLWLFADGGLCIPFDDDTEADEAEILVYNLADETLQGIQKGNLVTVTAGYGEDTGVIFSGFISKKHTSFSGMDKVTQIFALDSEERKERDIEEGIAYQANT